MIHAAIPKFAFPLLLVAIGTIGGIGVQQKLFSKKENIDTKQFSDEVRKIVSEELSKLPKPEPTQGLEIEKIKGKGSKVEIKQNYYVQADTAVIKKAIEETLNKYLSKSNYKNRIK